MFAGPPDVRTSGEQQQPLRPPSVHQPQQKAPHATPAQHVQLQPAPAAAGAQLMGTIEGKGPGDHPGFTCQGGQGSDGKATQPPANVTSSSAGASGAPCSTGVEQLSGQQQQPLTADVRQVGKGQGTPLLRDVFFRRMFCGMLILPCTSHKATRHYNAARHSEPWYLGDIIMPGSGVGNTYKAVEAILRVCLC